MTAAADTLFGAIAIGITAGALLYCDHGKIRFFTLFAIARRCASVADPSRKAAQNNDYEA